MADDIEDWINNQISDAQACENLGITAEQHSKILDEAMWASNPQVPEFTRYPKIPRYENETWTISEKTDGSNGVIYIPPSEVGDIIDRNEILAGSRSQWLGGTDKKGKTVDNHGFYAWVKANWVELVKLGAGYHHGEWYGEKINRNYGLKEKRFMLFNYKRYAEDFHNGLLPNCVELETVTDIDVPFELLNDIITARAEQLKTLGSFHVKGFKPAEGFIIRSNLRNVLYKVIISK